MGVDGQAAEFARANYSDEVEHRTAGFASVSPDDVMQRAAEQAERYQAAIDNQKEHINRLQRLLAERDERVRILEGLLEQNGVRVV